MCDLLIIDDTEMWRTLIGDIVDSVYSCRVVSTFEEAKEAIDARNYKIISLNYQFHTYSNGRKLLMLLKNDFPDVPVILITGAISGRVSEVQKQCQIINQKYPNVKEILLKGGDPKTEIETEELSEALLDTMDRLLYTKPLPPPTARQKNTFLWLHLSDLHFGCEGRGQNWGRLQEALLKDIKEHLQPVSKRDNNTQARLAEVVFQPDAILITGDIAYHGDKKEYENAQNFLESVWKLTGLGKEQTIAVPGNHDVDRSVLEEMFLTTYEKYANQSMDEKLWVEGVHRIWEGAGFREQTKRKFNNYLNFSKICTAIPTAIDDLHYVYSIPLATGYKIEVVCFNSALMSCRDKEDIERGLWIGPQFDALEESFCRDAALRIALVHHPLEAIHPYDIRWTWSRIEKTCPILLHGHLHKPEAVLQYKPEYVHFKLSGGSVHNKEGFWVSQHYSYCQFDLETKDLDIYMRMTTSDTPNPIYIRDNQTYPEGGASGHVRLHIA